MEQNTYLQHFNIGDLQVYGCSNLCHDIVVGPKKGSSSFDAAAAFYLLERPTSNFPAADGHLCSVYICAVTFHEQGERLVRCVVLASVIRIANGEIGL